MLVAISGPGSTKQSCLSALRLNTIFSGPIEPTVSEASAKFGGGGIFSTNFFSCNVIDFEYCQSWRYACRRRSRVIESSLCRCAVLSGPVCPVLSEPVPC